MTAIAQALRTALLDFVWQGLVVAFLLWVALYLLRRGRPQARYAAACAALTLMMALPLATAWRAYRTPEAVPAAAAPAAAPTVNRTAAAPQSPAPRFDWLARLEPWALPLWSAGVLFFSLRLVWSCWRVSAMRRRGQPADDDILAMVAAVAARLRLSRPVRVLVATLPDGPSVAGWLRPVLLLPPATVLGLTTEQLEAVLAHELAHIRRYDHLVNAAQSLVETLLFYHPAIWWASARIREERELCCDDLAVRACGNPLCFARALTTLERLRIAAPSAALGSTGGSLMYRVQRLIGANPTGCAPSKLAGLLAFSLAIGCLVLNVHSARGQEQNQAIAYSLLVNDAEDGDAPGVRVDLGGAALLHRARVEYPESARNSGVQGTVAVQVTLDAAGNVSDAHVVSGPMELRKAVMSSVFEWHFAQASAGATRVVNVTFQKAPADAAAAREPQVEPGILFATTFSAEPPVTNGSTTVTPPSGTVELGPDTKRIQLRSDIENMRGTEGILIESRAETPARELTNLDRTTIKSIEVNGLPEEARADLISRLPLHVADTASRPSLEAFSKAVRKFDEHLNWHVQMRDDGGVSLIVNAPGHERGLEIRK